MHPNRQKKRRTKNTLLFYVCAIVRTKKQVKHAWQLCIYLWGDDYCKNKNSCVDKLKSFQQFFGFSFSVPHSNSKTHCRKVSHQMMNFYIIFQRMGTKHPKRLYKEFHIS